MDYFPKHYGGKRPDPEAMKREGWHSFATLVVSVNDVRLSLAERAFIKQLGDRLYGEPSTKADIMNVLVRGVQHVSALRGGCEC